MVLRGPVLVGTDLRDAAREAVRAGTELARGLESRVIVCHVIPELFSDVALFQEFRRTNHQARVASRRRTRCGCGRRLITSFR
jgi:hypothetical protein